MNEASNGGFLRALLFGLGAKLNQHEAASGGSYAPGLAERHPTPGTPPAAVCPEADRIRALGQLAPIDNAAFQSFAVAAIKTLRRAYLYECQAARAAISLAQREKLLAMTEALKNAADALESVLSTQTMRMLDHHHTGPAPADKSELSWWFSLTDAIQVLDEGSACIASLASGQPKGGPTRILSSILVRLFHRHHNELLSEAEQWVA